MKSYKSTIPADSLVQQYLPIDYTDAFACDVIDGKNLSVKEVMISFWTTMPNWVNALFKLRNILFRPFGLDGGESENRSEKLKKIINDGSGSAGLMSVTDATDNEIVILLSDKHLDAYMSVLIEKIENKQIVVATTLVRYHNRLGRIYFSLIRPFHMIVVKSMLINTLKRVTK